MRSGEEVRCRRRGPTRRPHSAVHHAEAGMESHGTTGVDRYCDDITIRQGGRRRTSEHLNRPSTHHSQLFLRIYQGRLNHFGLIMVWPRHSGHFHAS